MYVQAFEFDCETAMTALPDFKKTVQKYTQAILEKFCEKEDIRENNIFIEDITIDQMFDRNTRNLTIVDNMTQLKYLIHNIDKVFEHISELNPLFLVDAHYKQFSIDIKPDSRFPDKFHAVIVNGVDPIASSYEVTIQWVPTP